jgi:hypothetical protein
MIKKEIGLAIVYIIYGGYPVRKGKNKRKKTPTE